MPDKMIPIHCPLCCDQPFEDQQSLFFHLRALRNNLFCTICSERFDTLENLISHLSRKCNGPTSLDAKRKCLLSISANQVGYQPDECSSTDNIDEPTVAGNVSSIIQSGPEVSESSQAECVVGSTNIINSNPSKKQNSRKSAHAISPELKNKLSKNVTLGIGPSSKTSNSGTVNSKANPSTNINEVASKLNEVSMAHLSSLNAFSKVGTNSTVKVPGKTPTSKKNIFIGNPFTSTTPTTKMPVKQNQLEKNLFHPDVSKNTSLKSGLQTSVQVGTTNKKTVSSVNSQQITKALPISNLASATLQNSSTSNPLLSHLNPVAGTPNSIPAWTNSGTPKRGRGRPRKYPLDSIHSPEINGKVQKPEPRYVLPDIIDEAELYGINEDKTGNQHVSVKSADCHSSETESDGNDHLEEYENQEEDDDKPDLLKDFNSKKSKIDLSLQKDDKNCLLNVKEGNETSLEKVETKKETEGIEEENDAKSEDEEYTCSACNVRFLSICEHIREFHNGEEVVVEVPEEEINEELKAYQGDKVKFPNKDVGTTSRSVKSNKKGSFLSNTVDNKTEVKHSDTLQYKSNSSSEFNKLQSPSNKTSLSGTLSSKHTNHPPFGKWVRTSSGQKVYYQFITNHAKLNTLVSELSGGGIFINDYNATFKHLFENPKINLIEVTDKPIAPFFTYKKVDFEKPIPMYVVERQINKGSQTMLGNSASYILANPDCKTPIPASSTLISVMNVVLASDKELSIENVVFNKKPCENMIPVLEDVTDPVIPILNNAKMLKWMCTKCLTVTWKFPLSPESHICNTCRICHKPFVSSISLRKHLVMHKKDGSKFCVECNKAFANRGLFLTHSELHDTHAMCANCKLFVPKNKEREHHKMHDKDPSQQFPCSVCQKVFGSSSEVKGHEVALCSRLVAKFNCSVCDKKFFSLTALSFHMKNHKSVIIQYPCRFCNKTFISEKEQCLRKTGKRKPSSYIQKIWHERIHTRERPYLCSACPKRFRSLLYQQSHTAQAHQGAAHRDLTVHMCRLCDKTFFSLEKLSSHMLTHNVSNSSENMSHNSHDEKITNE